jgi:formylglycine-generating enzyme required for sulfatase activity
VEGLVARLSKRGPGPAPPSPGRQYNFLSPAVQPDEIGRLGTYRVLKVLGAGGMGVVFQAEDPALKRKIALKAMLPSVAADASAKLRFLREAQAAAALEHDHIVRIFQVGEDCGVLYIAMPFLKGESLDDRLKRQPRLPIGEVLRIGRETASGLAAAHAQGLVHRDIKPANLWLEGDTGRVKILDFGLAKAASDAAQLTQSGVIVGTPAYMAPEQGGGRAPEPRSDLFSLGCVLYQACTGQPPFQGPDIIATLAALAIHHPPAPKEVRAQVPQRLSDLVMHLLAKKPADRPASAGVVAVALRDIEEQIAARAARPRPQVRKAQSTERRARGAKRRAGGALRSALRAPRSTLPWLLGLAGGLLAAVIAAIMLWRPALRDSVEIRNEGSSIATVPDKSAPPHPTPAQAGPSSPAKPSAEEPAAVSQDLTTGSVYAGGFAYDRGISEKGTIEIIIKERQDQHLQGTLGRGDGKLLFAIAGTLQGRAVQWELGQVLVNQVNYPAAEKANRVGFIGKVQDHVIYGRIASHDGTLGGVLRVGLSTAAPPTEFTNSIGMKLVLIPHGEFLMGSPKEEEGRADDETQHKVEITRPFYLGVYEVTQEQYEKVMGTNPSYFSATGQDKDAVRGLDIRRLPVERVSWDDAQAFCRKLTERDEEKRAGRVYRLPTEAEWEYAARAGTPESMPYHVGKNLALNRANFGPNLRRTQPVGSYAPNAFALFDMHGNVWEWCQDWYDPDYYKHSPQQDPPGPASGTTRIVRSGSWVLGPERCRAAFRGRYQPGDRHVNSGLRVACTLRGETP